MPLYEYYCKTCATVFERLRSYPERHETVCKCGLLVRYIPSAPARTKFQWGDTEWDGRKDRGLGVTLRDENHRKQLMKQRGLRELNDGEAEAEIDRVRSEHAKHEQDMRTYNRVLNDTGSAATAMAQTFPDPITPD